MENGISFPDEPTVAEVIHDHFPSSQRIEVSANCSSVLLDLGIYVTSLYLEITPILFTTKGPITPRW